MEKKEEIIKHIIDCFAHLVSAELWDRPSLDNLAFDTIGMKKVRWLKRSFEEEV